MPNNEDLQRCFKEVIEYLLYSNGKYNFWNKRITNASLLKLKEISIYEVDRITSRKNEVIVNEI